MLGKKPVLFIGFILAIACLATAQYSGSVWEQPDLSSGEKNDSWIVANYTFTLGALHTSWLNFTQQGFSTQYPLYDPSLVLYYSFENYSALGENDTKVVDQSYQTTILNGRNGTVVGGNSTTPSLFGRAMQFNGSQYVRVDSFNLSNLAQNSLSFSFWIKSIDQPNTKGLFSQSASGGFHVVYAGYPIASYITWAPYIGVQRFFYITGFPWGDNQWHFIAFTFNGSNAYSYVDGVKNNSYSGFCGGTECALTINSSTSSVFEIGSQTTGVNFFNGSIDEIKIWNRTLSPVEIMQQYNSSSWIRVLNTTPFWQASANFSGLQKGNYSTNIWANNTAGSVRQYWYNYTSMKPTAFTCYDEQNPASKLNFNLTVIGDGSFNNRAYVSLTAPVTNQTVSYSLIDENGLYLPRQFQLLGDTWYNKTCYLLKTSASSIVRIRTLTYGDLAIPLALITVNRTFSGVSSTVDQQYTDTTGTATFYLDPLATYTFTASATGFQTGTFSFQASSNDYRIYLTSTQQLASYNSFYNVSYFFIPYDNRLNISDSELVSFTLADSGNAIEYYGLYVYWNNTLLTFINQTGASGGTASYSLNTSAYQQAKYIFVTGFFKKQGFDPVNISITVGLMDLTIADYSLEAAFRRMGQMTNSNMQPFFGVISLIIATMASLFVAGGNNWLGGGAIAVVVLGGCVIMGWLPFLVWATTAIVVGSIFMLRGRI